MLALVCNQSNQTAIFLQFARACMREIAVDVGIGQAFLRPRLIASPSPSHVHSVTLTPGNSFTPNLLSMFKHCAR